VGAKRSGARSPLDAGLGKDLNLALIAALLSVAVAFPTALITSRVNLGNEREQERRAREREAIAELERAMLREIDATVKVVVEGLPATPVVVQGAILTESTGTERADPTGAKLAMVDFLSARRECEAARQSVHQATVKDASTQVSALNARIVAAPSEQEAQRINPALEAARRRGIEVIDEALDQL
jgi:hypothetical protein